MKNLSLILLAAWLAGGCANVEKNAYLTVGTTSVAVEAARAAYIDYANTGRVPAKQFAEVKALYEKYQAAMEKAQAMLAAYQANPEPGADNLMAALQPASAAASALIELVRSYLPSPERERLNAKIKDPPATGPPAKLP